MNTKAVIPFACVIVLVLAANTANFLSNGLKSISVNAPTKLIASKIGSIITGSGGSKNNEKISTSSSTATLISTVSTATIQQPGNGAPSMKSDVSVVGKRSPTAISSEIAPAAPGPVAASEAEGFKKFVLKDGEERVARESCDWRKVGAVTAVKEQHKCGSCWAFATTALLEFKFRRDRNISVAIPLSEQVLFDCTEHPFKWGAIVPKCYRGGNLPRAMKFAQKYGVRLESTNPYRASGGKCDLSQRFFKLYDMEIWSIDDKNEDTIKEAVYRYGPISCALEIPASSFEKYDGKRVYGCKRSMWEIVAYHAVSIVGYGTDPQEGDYWIVRNSWGSKWGENGYMRMARNINACNITKEVYFLK